MPDGRVLVSFCNVRIPDFVLGVFELSSQYFAWVHLEETVIPTTVGAVGICAGAGHIFVGLQHTDGTSGIAALNRQLQPVHYTGLRLAADVHSLEWHEGTLWIADTAHNRLVTLPFDSTLGFRDERVAWTSGEEHSDVIHLNSIAVRDGDLLISCFGEKRDKWNDATYGQVINVTREVLEHAGLRHPHSLLVDKDRLFVLESKTGILFDISLPNTQKPVASVPGYARGLALIGHTFVVGVSAARRKSKSTGTINQPASLDMDPNSRLYLVDHEGRTAATFTLTAYGGEIYDVLPLPHGIASRVDMETTASAAGSRIVAYDEWLATTLDPKDTETRDYQTIMQRAKHAGELRVELERIGLSLERVELEKAELEAQIAELRRERDLLASQATERELSLSERVEALRQESEDRKRDLDAVFGSRSWRLTAPIRSVWDCLQRLKRP